MPLSRYKIRNEFSLADPDLYGAADKDDPEAVLEAVAMAGLVGVLRQLGDLAEFAAEIFHDLHEEVLATAARGHSLTIRVQQLEADFPSIENMILSQTSHSSFFYNSGTDWHPNFHMDQNLVTHGDLPRFVMDSYEECRGPPRLFLLDKFDIAGAGACLKRYTDPSFFKQEASSFEMINSSFHRERRTRKAKKKGQRGRNSQTPEVLPTSHVKLHQLFMEEELIENGNNDSRRHVKLKRRLNGFPFDSKTGKSYMEKFLRTPSPEHKAVHEVCVESMRLKLPSSSAYETEPDYSGTRKASGDEKVSQSQINLSPSLSPSQSEENDVLEHLNDAQYKAVIDDDVLAISTRSLTFDIGDNLRTLYKVATGDEVLINGEDSIGDITKDYHSDDFCSEADNYMDALASMDSDLDTDSELRARTHSPALSREKRLTTNLDQIRSRSCDSQSVGNSTLSDDANSVSKKDESNFSSSGSPSTSVETTAPLEGHAANMTEIREIQMCSPVDLQHVGEGVASAHPSEHAFFDGSTVAAEHHSQSYDLEQSSTSTLQDCSLKQGIVKAGTVTNDDALVKPNITETLSTLDKVEFTSAGVAKTGASQQMVASAPKDLVNPGQEVGDLPPIVSAKRDLLGDIHTTDLNEGNDLTYSANHPDVPCASGYDIPVPLLVDVHKEDLSNNLYATSNMFPPQSENKYLDMLGGEVLGLVENRKYLDDLSHGLTSSEIGYLPSSSTVNYSNDELDNEGRNVIPCVSVHLPNILEASLEEEHIKHDLCIASMEGSAEDNCSHIREYHIDSPNLPVMQTESKPLDSASTLETVHTSVNVDETLMFEEQNAKDTCGTLSDAKVGSPNLSIMQTAPQIYGVTHPILLLDTRELIVSQSMQANLDAVLDKKIVENFGHFQPGPSSTEGETSALSPRLDITSEEKPSILYVRVTEAHRLNDGGMPASLGIEGLQDDSSGPNEVGHHTTYLDQHDTDGYGHFQPEVLTWDPNKTNPMQLSLEQSSLNAEQRSFTGNNSRDAMGHTSHLQDHPCAEHEPHVPIYEFDHEKLGTGGTDSKHFPHKDQELFCQGDQDEIFDASSKFVVTNVLDQLPFSEGNWEDSSSSLASHYEKQKVGNKCSQLDTELLVGDEGISTLIQPPQSEQRQLLSFTEFESSVNPSSQKEKTEMPIHCSLPKLLPQEYNEGSLYVPSYDCAGVPGHVHHDESFDHFPKTTHESPPCQPSVPRLFPEGNNNVNIFEQCNNSFTCAPPGGGLHLEADQTNLEEMPPLPPLPPVQWRMGKFHHAFPYDRGNNNITPEMMKNEACALPSLPSKFDQPVRPLVKLPPLEITDEGSPLAYQNSAMYYDSFPSHMPNEVYDENDKEFFDVLVGMQPLNSSSQVIHVDKAHTLSFKTSSGELVHPAKQVTDDTNLDGQEPEKDFKNLEKISSVNTQGPFVNPGDSPSVGSSLLANTGSTSLEENFITEIESVQPEHPVALDHKNLAQPESDLAMESGSSGLNLDKASVISQENLFRHETRDIENESTQPEHQIASEMNLNESDGKGSVQVDENTVRGDTVRSVLEEKLRNPLHRKPNLDGDILWPAVEDGVVNGSKKMKLPRPRSPLIDAVAAHDKSKMRKVNDRVKPPVQKADERNNLLEQIRSKSFSLKPTVVTRPPSIQAPQTNLKVAAILERAKTIRQAFAGSDEEEDEDSWD